MISFTGATSSLRVGYYRSRRHALIQIRGKSFRTAPRKSFRTFTTDVKTMSEFFPDETTTIVPLFLKIIFDKFGDLIFKNYFELFLTIRETKFSFSLSRKIFEKLRE